MVLGTNSEGKTICLECAAKKPGNLSRDLELIFLPAHVRIHGSALLQSVESSGPCYLARGFSITSASDPDLLDGFLPDDWTFEEEEGWGVIKNSDDVAQMYVVPDDEFGYVLIII